jgi:hypothetical protein
MRIIKRNIIILMLFCLPAVCSAKTISGKEARRYIGDLKTSLTARPYRAVVLERRDPDPANGNNIDAILFDPHAGGYRYIRRLNADYRLMLNVHGGREAPVVTAENFSSFAKLIKDNGLTPYVIFDKINKESVIVYCGLLPCYIEHRETKDGSVLIDVRKNSHQEQRNYRENFFYKLY